MNKYNESMLVLAGILSIVFILNKKNDIPDNYIAVFHGGGGEITHETYFYKINNGKANYGFKYINVESTTAYWGSSDWKHVITKNRKNRIYRI